MDDLVKKLSQGKHSVEFETRTEDLKEIKERLDNGFVFIKFTETRGGTELGINLDKNATVLSNADFTTGKGKLQVVGKCELNYQKVTCIADIDLATRKGSGHLELLT